MRLHPLEQVEKIAGSKYTAVVAIAKRAMEANRRLLTMHASRRNPVSWAIQEIMEGKVEIVTPAEVPEATAVLTGEAGVAEMLRLGRFVHEEDIEEEAKELGLEKEIARAVSPEAEESEEAAEAEEETVEEEAEEEEDEVTPLDEQVAEVEEEEEDTELAETEEDNLAPDW